MDSACRTFCRFGWLLFAGVAINAISWIQASNAAVTVLVRMDSPHDNFTALAVSLSDPGVIYLGDDAGGLWSSSDAGKTWRRSQTAFGQPAQVREKWLATPTTTHPRHFVRRTPDWSPVYKLWRANPSGLMDFLQPLAGEYDEGQSGPASVSLDLDRRLKDWLDSEINLPFPRLGGEGRLRVRSLDLWGKSSVGIYPDTYIPGENNAAMEWLEVHPRDAKNIWASIGGRLRRSLDGGRTWTEPSLDADSSELQPHQLAFHPSRQEWVWLATNLGLYFSNDAGEHFAKVVDKALFDLPCASIAISSDDKPTVYVGTQQGVFISSKDNPAFARLNLGFEYNRLPIRKILIDPANDQHLVLLSDSTLVNVAGLDHGATPIEQPLATMDEIRDLKMSPEGTLVVASRRDLWESINRNMRLGILLYGSSSFEMQQVYFTPRSNQALLLTDKQLMQVQRQGSISTFSHRVLHTAPTCDPSQVVEQVWSGLQLSPEQLESVREKSVSSFYFPALEFRALAWMGQGDASRSHRLFMPLSVPSQNWPVSFANHQGQTGFIVWLTARWELERVFFPGRFVQTQTRRTLAQAQSRMADKVMELCQERSRIPEERPYQKQDDLRSRLLTQLRLEELDTQLQWMTKTVRIRRVAEPDLEEVVQ